MVGVDCTVSEIPGLPRYVSLIKNVRGIAVYDPADPPAREFFTWLSRRHQYRNVGIPGRLMEHPTVDVSSYKTFERLASPVPGGDDLVDDIDKVPPWTAESLLLGSAYAAPLFIDPPALDAFNPAASWELVVGQRPDTDQVLRHTRIAGYGTIDFLQETAENAVHALRHGSVDEGIDDRASLAQEDGTDRFWRLLEDVDDTAEQWVGGYFDPLPLLPEKAHPRVTDNPDLSVYLGLVGGFVVLRNDG